MRFFFFSFYTISSWWRWRAPMTDSPRSNRSGWMSSTNWELMWKCVTWLPLEPEELVWIKTTGNNWSLRLLLSKNGLNWVWYQRSDYGTCLICLSQCYCRLKAQQFCINKFHAIPSKQMFLVVGSNAAKWNFNHPSRFHTALHTAHQITQYSVGVWNNVGTLKLGCTALLLIAAT